MVPFYVLFVIKVCMEQGPIDIVESPQPSEQQPLQLSLKWHHIREKQLLSRLLYPNPVCLLTTTQLLPDYLHHNAMVISWLTPIDNDGNIFLSINAKRHTAARLMTAFRAASEVDQTFVLNVPTASQESMVLQIGGCSGRDIDKFDSSDGGVEPRFTLCRPGWTALTTDTSVSVLPGSSAATATSTGVAVTAASAVADAAVAGTGDRIDTTTTPAAPFSSTPAGDVDLSLRARRNAKKQRRQRDPVGAPRSDCVALRECVAHIVCTMTHMYADSEEGEGDGTGGGASGGGSGSSSGSGSGSSSGSGSGIGSGSGSSGSSGSSSGDRVTPASHKAARHRHYRLFARMQQAFVSDGYWDRNHNVLRPTGASHPPLLSFLGSKQFAHLS